MRRHPFILAVLLLAGCVTTDGNGKPIARESKPRAADALEAAIANATLDGSRVVASGRAGAVSFIYPGTGRLAVRDLTLNTMPFSVELTERDGPAVKTLVSIAGDGKLTGTTSASDGPAVTELGSLDKSHTFIITYLPVGQSAVGRATP